MARRRLLTVLASTLAAGIVSLPAAALPGLDEPLPPPVDQVVEPVEEGAETLVTTVEEVVAADAGSDDAASSSDDASLLPTDEGEPLEPLAPVTDPVEEALAPVLEPVEPVVAPAEPIVEDVVDTVGETVGIPADDTADGADGGSLPTPPISNGSASAGDDATHTVVLDDTAPSAPELDTYWAGPGVSRGRTTASRAVDQQPQVAEPGVEEPLTAPAAQQPMAAGPVADVGPAGWEAALKIFAAFLVAATATMWQRAYAKAQIRR